VCALVGALPLVTGGAVALAGPDQSDAEILFQQGRKALEKGDEATACTKFEESLRLARSAGPLFNRAMCEEHQGHDAVAARDWREALGLVPPDDKRAAPALKRLAALEKKLGRIALALPAESPADAVLLLDGTKIDVKAPPDGSAGANEPGLIIDVDPGEHAITLDARGKPEVTMKATVAAGESTKVTFEFPKEAPHKDAPPKGDPSGPKIDPDAGKGVRIAGIVVGSVGLAVTGVGIATGILTILKKGEVEDNCVPTCNDTSRSAATDGRAFSLASSITFPAGLVLTALGTILVVTHLPKSGSPKAEGQVTAVPVIGPGFTGFVLGGAL
jgi:hypothetical protein